MIFKKQILFLISLFFVQLIFAQGGSTIKASVDKNKILIGEPIELTIGIYLSPESGKQFTTIDSIDHFEFLEKIKIDSSRNKGGVNITGVYKITSFDSGHWVIPSFYLSQDVKTDSIPIDVMFSDFDSKQPYHDIKDILEVKQAKRKIDWWWYVTAGAILICLLILYYKRKKAQPTLNPQFVISPYEEAIKHLNALEKDKLGSKQFHSALIDIFKVYVFRKKGILSLQKTTDDLVVQLKSLNLNKEQFDKLSQSLRLSDFVKFAKYIPAIEDDRNSFNEIKNTIMVIEKLEVKSSL